MAPCKGEGSSKRALHLLRKVWLFVLGSVRDREVWLCKVVVMHLFCFQHSSSEEDTSDSDDEGGICVRN